MKIPEPRRLPSGKWNVQVSMGGHRRSITKDTKDECIREAMLMKARAKEQRDMPAEKMTLGAIMDTYIEDREASLSPSTLRHYKTVRQRVFPHVIDKRYMDVRGWQKTIAGELSGVNSNTARGYWSIMKAAIKAAGLPVPDVAFSRIRSDPRPYLRPEEIPVFLDAIRGHHYELEILLGLHGLRAGEICGLRWQDLDLKRRLIHVMGSLARSENGWIRKDTTKTEGSRRTVPFLIPRLDELLAERDRSADLIDTNPQILYVAIARFCREHGYPKIGCHGLRRSFASLAYHLGVPERVAMELGGWTTLAVMHEHYIQIAKDDVDVQAARMRSFFETKKDPRS